MQVDFAELATYGLLKPMLKARLMFKAIEDIELSEQEVQQAWQMFVSSYELKSDAELQTFAERQLLTPQALEKQVLQPYKLKKLCDERFSAKAESRFLERKQELDRVVYSLLRLSNQGLARELYLQIASGEANFADLAAQYSEGHEKGTRGIVGPVPLNQAHPTLMDRLRTATPGVVIEPFQIQDWWLVVRLEQLTPASFDQDIADAMSRELFELWIDEQLERNLADLRPQLLSVAS